MENTLSPCSMLLPQLWWPLVTFYEVRGAGCHSGRSMLSSPPQMWWEVCSEDSGVLAPCHSHSGLDMYLLPEERLGADRGQHRAKPLSQPQRRLSEDLFPRKLTSAQLPIREWEKWPDSSPSESKSQKVSINQIEGISFLRGCSREQ